MLLAPALKRGIYVDRGHLWSSLGVQPYTDTYTQPRWRHAVAAAWHWFDMVSYDVPGFRALERLDERWHQRKCNDDCGEFTSVATGDKVRACSHIPLCARMDLICFELQHKERVTVGRAMGELVPVAK